ncbi:MAG TPA: carbohydrate kinase family protein [Candidatus Kapabacteria bacterium]|nr:carbohydrate kinase family protein [Candidatus Kapabacteria bacterium]
MKFLLIGHPCVDEIHTASGEVIRSWGGIYYTLAAMEHAARLEDVIVPIFPIGKDEEAAFRDRLSGYKHLDLSALQPVDAPTNKMQLFYKNGSESGQRDEHCACVLPPIDYDMIRLHMRDSHFVFVNMVSGFELTLDTLRKIRSAGRRPHVFIYLDVHAMVLGDLVENGPRKFRQIKEWENWVMNVDGIQMNENEVKYFSRSEKSLVDFAATFHNIQVIVITRGEKGTSIYIRDAIKGVEINEVFSRLDIPPVMLGQSRDSTGCGDVYGGAFIMHYAWTRHAVLAAQFASYVAAAKSMLPGSEEIDKLRDYITQYPIFQ